MKKNFTFFSFLFLLFVQPLVHGQDFVTPTVGAGYGNFNFYKIATDEATSYANDEWDLAFTLGLTDLGVHINEAVGLSFSAPPPPAEFYVTNGTEFATVDTSGMMRIHNNEVSWAEGALNHVAMPGNPADYGWGNYDFMNHVVNGSRVFAAKLRSGQWKKFMIESLAGGVYTLRHADLDGSNEVTATIDKADFAGKAMAYYSMETDEVLDLEPASWDLLFTRYTTPLDDGTGTDNILQYVVTGVLSGPGVEIAKAEGVDPATVLHTDYADAYSAELNVIGYDWKSFTGMGWALAEDVAYFVKTADGAIWKVVFIDFEGSSTGTSVMQVEEVSGATSTTELPDELSSLSVYPNPASDRTQLVFDWEEPVRDARLYIVNGLGQTVQQQILPSGSGLQVIDLPVSHLSAGMYQLVFQLDNDLVTRQLIVK